MNTTINFVNTYFTEEKIESLFILIIGITSIILALIFLSIIKYSFYKGLAFPLLIIGIIQLSVGSIIVKRSPKDIIRVEKIIKESPQKIGTEELPRMEKVIKNFRIYFWIEILFMLTGIIFFIYFYSSKQTFWKGLGLGLLIQATLLLSLDLIAKDRAVKFVDQLTKISH